jgi:hypothetical protein
MPKQLHGFLLNAALFTVTLLFTIQPAYSGVGGFNEWRIKTGHVMSRGLILTDDGNPIYAEYLSDGSLGADIAPLDASLEDSYVISGDSYRAVANYYTNFISNNSDGIARGAQILSANAYQSRQFTTVDGTPINAGAKSPLLSNRIKTVLVRSSQQMLIAQTDPSLVQASINLNNIDSAIVSSSSIKSVLLNKQGDVVHSSSYNIGFKSAFYENDQNTFSPSAGDKIYAPVPGIGVELPSPYLGGRGITDGDGRFVVTYMLPPCPGFQFEYKTPITATLHFGLFNPKGDYRSVIYPLTMPGYDFCSGLSAIAPSYTLSGLMTQIAVMGIEASLSYPVVDYGFKVDTAVLSGKAYLTNSLTNSLTNGSGALPISETKYSYQAPDLSNVAYQGFDFDGDGTYDLSVLGDAQTQQNDVGDNTQVFTPSEAGSLQGIYLSSGSHNPNSIDPDLQQPDFVRLADKAPDFQHQGLLANISSEDLIDTDILVFRESNGMLITSRMGLKKEATTGINQGGVGDDNLINFSMMMRGPNAVPWDYFGGAGLADGESFSLMQSEAAMNPALHQRKADHIRPHEKIRVVAINRKTGYIGTARTNYGSFAADSGTSEGVVSMMVTLGMKPPNLKIIAEREYIVAKGLTAGDKKEYLIGYEGAALASDTLIKVTTQWLDHDGSPLPEGLADYGYTARLAKIVDTNTLGQDGSALANFSIKPGRHTEQVQIGSDATQNEHYYVQVSGEPINGNPTFDTLSSGGGAGNGPLQYRPKHYVPVLTPVADEQLSWQQYQAYIKYKKANPDATLEKPEPIYHWFYRPELQFSLYSLEIDKIFTQGPSNTGQQIDIYPNESPVISSGDDLVKVLYSLLEQEIAPLGFLGAGQELVLALGEEEVVMTVGESQQLIFNNLDHLASLDVEDFLSMRLYSNNDASNILWGYAFEHVILTPNLEGVKEITVTADEPELAFNMMFVGYSSRDVSEQELKKVQWEIDGNFGYFSPAVQSGQQGSFSTVLNTTTFAGSEGYLYYRPNGSHGDRIKGPKIKVIAGKPASIDINVLGTTAIGGIGEIIADITVKDHTTQKVEDGTSVGILYSDDLDVEYIGSTLNGKVRAHLKGGNKAGVINLNIYSGSVQATKTITVDDVDLSIDMPSSVEPRSQQTILINASSAGHNLNGKVLTLRTSKGKLKNNEVVIQNGVAQTTLAAGSILGQGFLTASFNDVSFAQKNFTVEYPSSLLRLNEPVLVGDKANDGTVTVDKGNGESFEAPYVVSTELALTGIVGSIEKVSIGSIAAPPIEPVVSYSLSQVYGDNVVGDAYGMIDGKIENVTGSNESEHGFNGSYVFDASAKLTVPHHVALQKQNNIGFGLKVKPQSSGSIVDYTASAQKLTLLADNKFQYQVTTTDGSYQVESEAVDLDKWHTVGVRYQQGELILEVNGKGYTAAATGNLVTSNTSSNAIVIGEGFNGSASNFRVTDWDYPLLATLPNGSYEMDVTFASESETVRISSTNKLGTRPMGYTAMQGIGNGLFAQAHANDFFNSFIGEVTFQAQAINYALVETAKWSVDTSKGFALGLILGDTSTTAGVIGDIAMGFIPLGDARDVGLHEWYIAHNTLDENGRPKYDETILYLSYIGLGADAIMLTPAVAVGVSLNAAVAVIKPAMKLINGMPGKKVLGAKFKEIALAARDRDWTRFKALSLNILPFMELFAAVAIDEELRNLLIGAVRNTADLDNWSKYLKGFAQQAGLVGYNSPLPSYLFDDAYAATSGFKVVLQAVVKYQKEHGIEDIGSALADTIGGLRKSLDNNSAIAKYAYKTETIKALINIEKLGGADAINKLANFKHISQGVAGGSVVGDMRIEKLLNNLAELDLTKVPTDKGSGQGFSRIFNDLANRPSFAKGAAHAINVLKRIQKGEVTGLTGLGVLTGIEKNRGSLINGVSRRTGREDFIFGDTILELKSYNPGNLRNNLVGDMKGKVNKKGEQVGLQLFTNVLEMVEGKDIRMVFEKFDGIDVAMVRKTLDEVVTNALKTDKKLRRRIAGWYEVDKGDLDDYIDAKIIKKFRAKLDRNILVVD